MDEDPALGDYSVDTDADGLPDLAELGKEIEVSEFDWTTHTPITYKCWTFKSNPAVADTDGDGIGDKYDKRPIIFDSRVIEQNDDYVLFSTGNKWEKFSFNYYDLMNEISKMSWSNIDDQGYGKKLAPYFDNDKINFSTEELNYIYDYDPMGVRSYLTANQHHSLVEDVYRVRTHVPSVYYKYDSFTEKWSLTEETYSDFGDSYKVFSTAELMFTYDTQIKMNIDDLFDIVNRIVAVGMFFVGEFNPSALEKAGEEYGVKAAEDLVFTGSNEVMSTVEPELQGLSEDALEAVNAVEEKELVNLLNASDETEIETVKAEMLADAKGVAGACSNGWCFTGDTLVYVQGGHKAIKNIAVGDEVYSENPSTGEKGLKRVKTVYVNETDILTHIYAGEIKVSSTPTHRFWVVGKEWVYAKDIKAGDKLQLYSGEIIDVTSTEQETFKDKIKVYNFEVEDWHTYFVSSSNIWVHNEGCSKGILDAVSKATELEIQEVTPEVNAELELLKTETSETEVSVIQDEIQGDIEGEINKDTSVQNNTQVIGGPHSTPEHRVIMADKADEFAKTGKYDKIYMNKSLKAAGLNGTERPDIIAIDKDGNAHIIEIASQGQMSGNPKIDLINKYNRMLQNNPGITGDLIFPNY